MPASPELVAHARDLFAGLGPITTGRMFSGSALYVEGDVMFAAILGDVIWMKSDDATRAAFEEAGARAFSYTRATGARQVTSLMSLPDAAMDDPAEALGWARLSLGPARAAAEKKRREKARKKSS